MIALIFLALNAVAALFKSKSRLEAENAALRQQLIVLRRKVHGRVRLSRGDRLFFVQLYRWFPSILKVIAIVRPETLVRWHRAGFRRYWRWKSLSPGGRPPIGAELRALIRRMSLENPLWGAPRIHGELLKLGFAVAQSSVAKYMARRSNDPSGQSWATFVRNHAAQIAAMDLFVVPTIGFDLLYALIIVQLDRRELVWVNGARKYRLRRWAPSLMASVVRCKSRDPASRIRRSLRSWRCDRKKMTNMTTSPAVVSGSTNGSSTRRTTCTGVASGWWTSTGVGLAGSSLRVGASMALTCRGSATVYTSSAAAQMPPLGDAQSPMSTAPRPCSSPTTKPLSLGLGARREMLSSQMPGTRTRCPSRARSL